MSLESIKDLADEIIVVDTGSTDSTKEIAREFTDHVYDVKWVNDFSAARNESLRHATCKWILVLDADEYLNKDDIQEYRLFLRDEDANANCTYSFLFLVSWGSPLQMQVFQLRQSPDFSLTSRDLNTTALYMNN